MIDDDKLCGYPTLQNDWAVDLYRKQGWSLLGRGSGTTARTLPTTPLSMAAEPLPVLGTPVGAHVDSDTTNTRTITRRLGQWEPPWVSQVG